jgi:hypothetical protein
MPAARWDPPKSGRIAGTLPDSSILDNDDVRPTIEPEGLDMGPGQQGGVALASRYAQAAEHRQLVVKEI